MTRLENLEMGTYIRKDRKSAAKQADLERVFSLFPRLLERAVAGAAARCPAASSRCWRSAAR